MNTSDRIDSLKDINDDLEVALQYMKAEGYTDKNDGYIWVACALDDLKEVVSRMEKDYLKPKWN
jgi:hypothetical protein